MLRHESMESWTMGARAFPIPDQAAMAGGQRSRLTRDALDARLLAAIDATREYEVVYQDLLGEGPGAWHDAPRYPRGRVNCLIWLQLVLAEAYGNDPGERQVALDRIRYYGGHPAFSLRKHYVDHWLAIEPEPLRPVSLGRWGAPRSQRVVLDPARFLAHVQFPLPMYRMQRRSFDVAYHEPIDVLNAARELPSGCRVAFAVPSEAYLDRYGTHSGPMGLVHGLVVHLSEPGSTRRPRPVAACVVHHASTSAGRVVTKPLDLYLRESWGLHRGYALYDLDPGWGPTGPLPWDEEAHGLWERERLLAETGARRSVERDFGAPAPIAPVASEERSGQAEAAEGRSASRWANLRRYSRSNPLRSPRS